MMPNSSLTDDLVPISELGPPPNELNNGDRLTQKEFHALYERAGEGVHAELIGGIVYMASPLRARHGSNHSWLTMLFALYRGRTPGTHVGDNTTVILSDTYEPQPDLLLRINRECGGRSDVNSHGYISGPPELVAEVADSSRTIDLGLKRASYARHGVREYLVLNVTDERLHGHDLSAAVEIVPDANGVYRSIAFPGLWLNVRAIFADDLNAMLATFDVGLATPEHAAFVARLAAARKA